MNSGASAATFLRISIPLSGSLLPKYARPKAILTEFKLSPSGNVVTYNSKAVIALGKSFILK